MPIQAGQPIKASEVNAAFDAKENLSNKVTSISSGSTDTQYPSAKAVYAHTSRTDNPHAVTAAQAGARPASWTPGKADIGLGNVDNTSDASKPISTAVQTALTAVQTALSNLSFFPKGTILMYDGTSWQDNVTLTGWYKYEGQTVTGYGTLPNLKNRFVIGYDAANTPQRSRDNNSVKLGENDIPQYAPAAHTGKFSVADSDGLANATNSNTNEYYQVGVFSGVFSGERRFSTAIAGGEREGWTTTAAHDTVILNATHSAFGKKNSDGLPDAFDNRPSFYALIYIIKVTNAG